MKSKQITILLISISLITIGLSFLFYSYAYLPSKLVDVKSLPYDFTVQYHVGLVGDMDAVKFGGVSPGGFGKRWLHINNQYEFPVKVEIKIKGQKQEWISAEENNFVLQPYTYKNVTIIVGVPEYASTGNYTGILTAYYFKD